MIHTVTNGPVATNDVDPYWSRRTHRWEAMQRVDPVVWGSGAGPLTNAQVAGYSAAGYHSEQELLSRPEADALLDEADHLATTANVERDDIVTEVDNDVVRTIFRVHRTNDRFKALCKDERLVGIVRQLLGSDVYIHQSRINYKPALNGKEFFWHSDFETWHVEDGMPRMRAVSVSISLTASTEFNGPLMVVPGSHMNFIRCVGATPEDHFRASLRKQQYGVPTREALEVLVDGGGIAAPKGPPGSAMFFECNLMHGSTGNLSPYPRTNLFVVYNSVDNGVIEPFGDQPPRPEFLAEREIIPIDEL